MNRLIIILLIVIFLSENTKTNFVSTAILKLSAAMLLGRHIIGAYA